MDKYKKEFVKGKIDTRMTHPTVLSGVACAKELAVNRESISRPVTGKSKSVSCNIYCINNCDMLLSKHMGNQQSKPEFTSTLNVAFTKPTCSAATTGLAWVARLDMDINGQTV
jgi:hypothetical protein